MTHSELVARAKAILAEAYEEAAYMISEYLDRHPSESPKALCMEIDPDNWNALRHKVQRAQAKRKAAAEDTPPSPSTVWTEHDGATRRHARRLLREAEPEQLREIMADLPPERRAAVVRAAVPPPDREPVGKTGPTFIERIVRLSRELIEFEAFIADWQNLSAVPPEFSRDSFNDIAAKVLRIRDKFDDLAGAIEDGNEDEFIAIVRNFRVTTDAR